MAEAITRVACVTGATGVVGRWIVQLLIEQGWQVRALTRNASAKIESTEIYPGDLNDVSLLEEFVTGANAIFHCAGELSNKKLMHQTNVEGTRNLLAAMAKKHISYLCHLSSVGVMGPYVSGVVDEDSQCSPVGPYEETKLTAEQLVRECNVCDKIIILRPTNVIDVSSPGILSLSKSGVANTAHLLLKGSEGAHLVHAMDVAGAAVYFLDQVFDGVRCYIVSMDEHPHTVGQVCSDLRKQKGMTEGSTLYFPWQVTFWLRSIFRGASLKGDVVFSSKRLLKNGYTYTYGIDDMLSNVADDGGLK